MGAARRQFHRRPLPPEGDGLSERPGPDAAQADIARAMRIAAAMLDGSARPVPAMSKAVP